MATVNLTGKWKEDRSENKEAFLKKMGTPEEKVATFAAFKPACEMIHEGENITLKMLTPDGKTMSETKFTIGTPYTPVLPDGVPSLGELISTFVDGGKVMLTKTTSEKVDFNDYTYLEPNGDLKVVQKSGDVTSTSFWTKM
ncbi:fatty acid-binding protein Fh15-like [Amphiura filiformis]|uniref:fatty acid-binding protein Fh15-like n=1 Tax=Amphiura filiformis TaxID=82378 RepID=UPI003B224935